MKQNIYEKVRSIIEQKQLANEGRKIARPDFVEKEEYENAAKIQNIITQNAVFISELEQLLR